MDDEDERWVCADCVGESYLKAEIERSGSRHTCFSCEKPGRAITVEDLADWIEGAFEAHYVRTSDQPDGFQQSMLSDRESSYEFERDGEEALWAIAEAADISEDIAEAVLEILEERHADFDSAAMGEECEFGPESRYERRDPNDIEFQLEWRGLERSLQRETRFFNKHAETLLQRIFEGVENYQTSNDRPVIRTAGPDNDLNCFYRARVFDADTSVAAALRDPDRELGPPPSARAVGGRMNPRGVSLFYGASDPAAALAEVRPPVGSRAVLARFDVIRPLRLLDIEALRTVYVEGSIFDSGYMGRLELAKFLERLSLRMTQPVQREDEPADYLITQVIADYLASNSTIDGLLYPSVQQSGTHQNVVLFRGSSRVAELDRPSATEVSVHLDESDEDGSYPSYSVFETLPAPEPEAEPEDDWGVFEPSFVSNPFGELEDARDPALKLAIDTLEVHHVRAISITTEAHSVWVHRFQPQERMTSSARSSGGSTDDDL